MGQNSRARRAAKQRKRARATQGRSFSDASWAPDPLDVACFALRTASQQRELGAPVDECLFPLLALPAATVAKAVELYACDALQVVFEGGWSPIDLVEAGRRHLDAAGSSYLLDLIAATTAGHPQPLVDPRWQAQLAELDGRVWWDPRRPHLPQWEGRAGRPRPAALATALEVFTLLGRLPRIDVVLPPPGTRSPIDAPPTVDPAQERVLSRVMSKVRSLLAKAESTDSDDEAELLSAKAQELMSRYSLDRALIDHAHGVRQQATIRRIWLDAPYVNAKAMLVSAVADANRCRAVLADKWGYAAVVGDQTDLRMVELLTTSLLVQATRALRSSGAQHRRAGVSRTRSYRQSFLVAYASRIGERLRAADQTSTAAADADRLLPVLSARSRAVDELLEQRFPELVATKVSVSNAAGWGAGLAAADLALFDIHEALGQPAREPEPQRKAG